MASFPHNSPSDSPPSQNADLDEPNQPLEAPVLAPMVSSDCGVPLQENETTGNSYVSELLRASLSLQLQLTASRFRVIDTRLESISLHLMRYESHDSLLSDAVKTFRQVTGEPEVVIRPDDADSLNVVQNLSVISDVAKKDFDVAMSKFKACCDGLDRIEQGTADFLNSFETTATVLAAEDLKTLETLRNVPGEIRLRRAKILTEVRSYW